MPRCEHRSSGMTLPELLLALLLLGLFCAVGLGASGRSLARGRVEAAARHLALGLEQARSFAEANGEPCALSLEASGWSPAADSQLPPCPIADQAMEAGVRIRHNLPGPLRISSNGLVLDGGTVVIAADGTELQRCLVVSLPLGMVRLGQSKALPGALPRSSDCVVDPTL